MIKSSFENELELSWEIQKAIVPHSLPRMQGIEMSSIFLPCDALGGDLFDVVQVSEDIMAFYILDISCQGISSALIASLAKVLFSHNLSSLSSPEIILNRINSELLKHISSDFFITAFLAFLDLHDNKLTYCNAGHPYPMIYRKSEKKVVSLTESTTFLGIYDDVRLENRSVYLKPEDAILFFTDGLYTLFRDKDDLLGRDCLEHFLLKEDLTSPQKLTDKMKKKLKYVKARNDQKDDITAIVVEVLTQSRRDQIKLDLGFSSQEHIYLQFLSYYEEIDSVLAHILKDMDHIGYSDESIRKMKLTITELLANAIGHGNKGDHTKKVTMGHIVKESDVTIGIMDEGEGFDINDIPDPTLPENLIKDRGRGLYIVSHYVDEMIFNDKGNRVMIRKFRTTRKKNAAH